MRGHRALVDWRTGRVISLAYSQSELHVNQALTNYAIGILDEHPYGADEFLPWVDVQKRTDTFWKWNNSDSARVPDTLRAPGTYANEVEFGNSTDTFTCLNYALAAFLPDEDVADADESLDFQNTITKALMKLIMKDREKRVMTLLTTPTNYPAAHRIATPTAKWDAATPDDPRIRVDAAKDEVAKAVEAEANVLGMNRLTFNALRRHPDVTEALKYTMQVTNNRITPELLAQFFDIDKVVVLGTVEETAAKGATSAMSFIWPDDIVVARVDPAPNRMSNHLGSSFTTRRIRTRTARDERAEATLIEVSVTVDEKLANNAAGAHIDDVLT